jgi:hypothetical protein
MIENNVVNLLMVAPPNTITMIQKMMLKTQDRSKLSIGFVKHANKNGLAGSSGLFRQPYSNTL